MLLILKKIILAEKQNQDTKPSVSTYEKHAYVVIGPGNVGRNYFMLKIFEELGNKRQIHIISRSPNQYPDFRTKTDIKWIDECKGSVVIFDDMLELETVLEWMNFSQEEDMKP